MAALAAKNGSLIVIEPLPLLTYSTLLLLIFSAESPVGAN